MEKKSKKSIIIGLTLLLLVTLILLGLTYAYYRTRVIGNQSEKSVSVTSKLLEVTYSDDSAVITASKIEPGYSGSKTFTVENTGNETVNFSIVIDNVENSFVRKEDWNFTLTDSTGNEIVSGEVPASKTWIKNSIAINSQETNTYTITITYANLTNVNQSEDMGKSLSFRINIDNAIDNYLTNATSGTLLAAIERDNLISEPLTLPGKGPSGSTLFAEVNVGSGTENISDYKQDYYYAYADSYTFDEVSGTYSLNNPQIATYSEVSTNLANKYVTTLSPSSSSTMNTTGLSNIYLITSVEETSYSYEKIKYTTMGSVAVLNIEEALLSATKDNLGTSYYFRGNVENNYVTYSGMCWRIVRLHGNGDIKLVLADRDNACGEINGYSVDDTDEAFIADPSTHIFIYGTSNSFYKNSKVEAILNAWAGITSDRTYTYYDAESYDATTETFTNEVLDTSKLSLTPNWCIDTVAVKTNEYEVLYGAYARLYPPESAAPSLECASSLENEVQVGMLTADEVAFAGSSYGSARTSYNHYLKTNATADYYMTLSPLYTDPSWTIAQVNMRGGINSDPEDDGDGNIRPAVVLRSDVTISSGDGTIDSPYVIS